MCDAKVKDCLNSLHNKELRQSKNRWHNIATTAKQFAMLWACVAKRRQWLGEEMYGLWSGGLQTKKQTKEDLVRGCVKRLSNT